MFCTFIKSHPILNTSICNYYFCMLLLPVIYLSLNKFSRTLKWIGNIMIILKAKPILINSQISNQVSPHQDQYLPKRFYRADMFNTLIVIDQLIKGQLLYNIK